jgi:hypothetical protein
VEESERTSPKLGPETSSGDELVSIFVAVQEVVTTIFAAAEECDILHTSLSK